MPPVPTPLPVHPSLRAPCLLPTPRFSFAYRQREIRGRGAGFRAEFRARIPGAKIGPDSGREKEFFILGGRRGLIFWAGIRVENTARNGAQIGRRRQLGSGGISSEARWRAAKQC